MPEVWPIDLPQDPLTAGYSDVERSTTIRSDMGYGPAKVRRRAIVPMRDITYQFLMSQAQVASLNTFYDTTLKGGTLTYDFEDYINGGSVELRMKTPPVTQPSGPDFSVRLFVEVMP